MSLSRSFAVYVPQEFRYKSDRLWAVVSAVERIADKLDVQFAGIKKRHVLAVSVYYEGGGNETRVYSDFQRRISEQEIYDEILHLVFAQNLASGRKLLLPEIMA